MTVGVVSKFLASVYKALYTASRTGRLAIAFVNLTLSLLSSSHLILVTLVGAQIVANSADTVASSAVSSAFIATNLA
jgi:hypothetical protein